MNFRMLYRYYPILVFTVCEFNYYFFKHISKTHKKFNFKSVMYTPKILIIMVQYLKKNLVLFLYFYLFSIFYVKIKFFIFDLPVNRNLTVTVDV